jgi:hypothetical protein
MTSQQFSNFLKDPGLVNDQSLRLFEDVVLHYPYCQSGQLLLACNYFVAGDPLYPDQLKKAAAYAGDRRILKELIGIAKSKSLDITGNQTFPPGNLQPAAGIPLSGSDSSRDADLNPLPEPGLPVIENAPPAYERMTQEELLAIVKKRLAEIEYEKRQEQDFSVDDKSQSLNSGFRIPDSELASVKASLIEKFIREEPRITKPKTEFFNPTDSAIRSNLDEEEIVSETLAQLYAQQGNIPKALHIYEKLTLLNQEKSRYFAAQIEKLSS